MKRFLAGLVTGILIVMAALGLYVTRKVETECRLEDEK